MKKDANWYEYPQKISAWDKNLDYVMFIDENGSPGWVNTIVGKNINIKEINENDKYLTITGCIFIGDNYSKMNNNIQALKSKYWENGFYFDNKYKDTRYVCLHSRDIRRHDGAFNDSLINYSNFMNDLSEILESVNCTIISVSIDLEKYIQKYSNVNVYEKAFDLLLERYIYTTKNNSKGIIIFESRGKKEDEVLLNHICHVIYKNGSKGIRPKEYIKKIDGIYFNPKWYENYKSTFTGLEIADLFSYPIHQYVKYGEKNKAFMAIEKKINCYPDYKNKGIKIFPNERDDK